MTRADIDEIGGARRVAVVVVIDRADEGRGAQEVDGRAEVVAAHAVTGCDLHELCAGGGVEEVYGAGLRAVVVVTIGPDDGRGAADGYGEAEAVNALAVTR